MENFEESSKKGAASSKAGFIKYVFNFDDDSKGEVMNLIQYALLSVVPIVLLNKLSQKYVPEADDDKGSLEILAEIVIQILVIFLGLFLINRIVTYVPTYSGAKYHDVNVITVAASILMITLSLQTKLGEKVSILCDRVGDMWNGYTNGEDEGKKGKKKKPNQQGGGGTVKVSQPISGQHSSTMMQQSAPPSAAQNQSLYSTPISQLPPIQAPQQSPPDYNSMFQSTYTPMPGAATPGEGFEPMAANAVGGGAFGDAFGGGF